MPDKQFKYVHQLDGQGSLQLPLNRYLQSDLDFSANEIKVLHWEKLFGLVTNGCERRKQSKAIKKNLKNC